MVEGRAQRLTHGLVSKHTTMSFNVPWSQNESFQALLGSRFQIPFCFDPHLWSSPLLMIERVLSHVQMEEIQILRRVLGANLRNQLRSYEIR